MKYTYDMHIHSALSPCAEEEMTPNNIVNMAVLNGLDIIAVTDHNSAGNLQAFKECSDRKGIVFVPGIEVESAEEVHIVCLFADVESACMMGDEVRKNLLPAENKPDIFGTQLFFDSDDNVTGQEDQMLLFASGLRLQNCNSFVGILWTVQGCEVKKSSADSSEADPDKIPESADVCRRLQAACRGGGRHSQGRGGEEIP